MKNSVLCYLEESVRRFPDKVALTDEERNVTFCEWKSMALCIADAITKNTKNRKIPVLVYLPKSVMTLVSFAGILYSGNYYTPTDVKFPFEKAASIMKCLMPEVIITDRKSGKKLLDHGVEAEKLLYVEDLDFSAIHDNGELLNSQIIDTDLAYVFFTSGSTGIPKGVAITHRSIVDYIDWAREKFAITSETKIANQAPFYFDNSILDIYLCMSCGAHLYITPEMYFTFTAKLLEYIKENEINFIFWVPSALIGVANSGLLERIDCSCIKKVLFCGEVMPNRHLNYWRRLLPDALYANLYGPTEITDVCSCYVINRKFTDEESLPIGFACNNTQIILLNDHEKEIKEKDVMGELCVRGTSLAVGYYNNPEKTAEAFIQNPLNSHYSEKIYRTGDLAHYNQYGEIMFDGRKDFQIKHMGYRIELGEIETAILSFDEVYNTCCIYDTEQSMIVAFCNADSSITELDIKKYLGDILPRYMIPAKYILLDKMPYNDNGKIDRKTLKKIYIDEGE
ncbi:MAG: amino acid adenylation domain-containing protein [Ruminococcus flavefaciens]|nr:amino acid adenylation domain-containing protein [Ruminococcus flavefaciens]